MLRFAQHLFICYGRGQSGRGSCTSLCSFFNDLRKFIYINITTALDTLLLTGKLLRTVTVKVVLVIYCDSLLPGLNANLILTVWRWTS